MNLTKQPIVRRSPADADGFSTAAHGPADSMATAPPSPGAVYAAGAGSELEIPDGDGSSQLSVSAASNPKHSPNSKSMGPRWKGKGCKSKALSNPMSEIVSRLRSSHKSRGRLSGSTVIVAVDSEQSELLNSACFGRAMLNVDKEKNWFQLGMEEAFYLCYSLNCLEVFSRGDRSETVGDLWQYMLVRKSAFPESYMAYSHLRSKNWVVRSGSQYGVDFVAYRHHPSLVHSEYAVLVLKEEDDRSNRLRVWSDVHCAVRLSGSVAKALLVLYIDRRGHGEGSPSCLNGYHVEERVVARWNPEQSREDQLNTGNGTTPECRA